MQAGKMLPGPAPRFMFFVNGISAEAAWSLCDVEKRTLFSWLGSNFKLAETGSPEATIRIYHL
jgi:hypothetical protein